MSRLRLPIHDPCHENWDAMNDEGASRRFCDVCTKHVHDLTAMTEREARSVLAEESAKGRVCVRYRADAEGNVRFRPETVEAPSIWRMTLAAAGLAMVALTGCTDAPPDRILEDKCVYEVGPWSFEAPRGQGTCPDVDGTIVEPNIDVVEPVMMGEAPAVIDPPQPDPHPVWAPPDPEPDVMGKIAIEPPPEPEPEHMIMGDVAAPVDGPKEPCDGPAPAPAPEPGQPGPRRL